MQFINSKKNLYLFAIFTVLPCLFLYSCIIYSGAGVNGGSVLALALMWVPGLAALATKLTIDHSVRGIGWCIHKNSLPSFAAAYLIPFGLCLVVYGLAWLTGLGRRGESSFPQYATFATLGVLLSMAASLGEEIGWRGFLLTELLRLFPENTVHLIHWHRLVLLPCTTYRLFQLQQRQCSVVSPLLFRYGYGLYRSGRPPLYSGAIPLASRIAARQPQYVCTVDF